METPDRTPRLMFERIPTGGMDGQEKLGVPDMLRAWDGSAQGWWVIVPKAGFVFERFDRDWDPSNG